MTLADARNGEDGAHDEAPMSEATVDDGALANVHDDLLKRIGTFIAREAAAGAETTAEPGAEADGDVRYARSTLLSEHIPPYVFHEHKHSVFYSEHSFVLPEHAPPSFVIPGFSSSY